MFSTVRCSACCVPPKATVIAQIVAQNLSSLFEIPRLSEKPPTKDRTNLCRIRWLPPGEPNPFFLQNFEAPKPYQNKLKGVRTMRLDQGAYLRHLQGSVHRQFWRETLLFGVKHCPLFHRVGESWLGVPLTSTLLTSTFVFRYGGFPALRGFELEWSLSGAASLEGSSVTSHEEKGTRAPFKGIKTYEGHPASQSGHVNKWSLAASCWAGLLPDLRAYHW